MWDKRINGSWVKRILALESTSLVLLLIVFFHGAAISTYTRVTQN